MSTTDEEPSVTTDGGQSAKSPTIGLNAKTPAIVRAVKSKCYDGIQRKFESDCYSAGVVQLKGETVCTILNVSDPHNPKTKKEAQAIAEACLYSGAKVPGNVSDMLPELPSLGAKYIYSNLPFMDKKGECLAFGKRRDREYGIEYDREAKKSKGGVSDVRDVAESKVFAKECGISMAQRVELEQSEDELIEENLDLQILLRGHKDLNLYLGESFTVAKKEVKILREALKTAQKKGTGVKVPAVTPLYKEVRAKIGRKDWGGLQKCLAHRFVDEVPDNRYENETEVPGENGNAKEETGQVVDQEADQAMDPV